MNFLGFGQSAEVDILFDEAESRKMADVKTEDGKKEKYLLYYDGETVKGKVNVTLKKPGSKLEHQGIKIELIGQIELFYDRGNHHEFTSLVKELARPGDLIQNTSYPFEFGNVEKPFEVYGGANVRLRYFLRVTIVRRLSDIIREVDIAVHTLCSYPDLNNPIKMEVGIEDCLHIEFEYNKSKYHLKDVIVGKIYFLLVRIKIKHMEIAIIKRETTGSGPNIFTENDTIAKYEIMDGAPVKGESIPIRVFLAGYDLTPTMRDINKKFSVKYFLNLVLMDTEDRRYFKQQEITLWRKADKNRKSQPQSSSNNPHVPTHLVGGPDNNTSSMTSTIHKHNLMGASAAAAATTTQIMSTGDDLEEGAAGGLDDDDDDAGRFTTTDPTIGLFVRESPQQESKGIVSDRGDASAAASRIESSVNNPLDIPISNTAEFLRGTADGASAQSDEAAAGGGDGLLFDIVPSAAATTTTEAKINTDQSPLDQTSESAGLIVHPPSIPVALAVNEPPPVDDDNNDMDDDTDVHNQSLPETVAATTDSRRTTLPDEQPSSHITSE